MPLTFKRTRTKAVTSFILVLILAVGLFTPWAGMPQARAAGDGPDLAVDSIATPETILAGHEVTVTASVYNTGNVPAEEFTVTLFAGQEEIQSKTVSSVYAGETAKVTFAWTPAQPGEYVLRVLADSSNRVAETDETNNDLTKEVTVGSGGEDPLVARVREAIARVTNYVKTQGTYSSDWLAVGLRNAGEEIPAGYLSEVEAAVQDYFATMVNTKREKVTDHERRVLGIVAAGGDPRNVGGYDLLERIYNFYIPVNEQAGLKTPRDITFQGLNGVIYGLIALDTMRWPIPEDARYSRDWLIQYLLDHQNADGGWDLGATGNSDVDITAMTLIGLAPYHDRQGVLAAIDRAVEWLSRNQSAEGGYYSWGTYNSESVSQTIIALCANGIDPASEQFTKNGRNLLDALLDFLQPDGSILHTLDGSGVTGMATEQGYQALLAYDKFVKNGGAYNGGRTSIYYFGEYGALKVAGKAADPSVTLAAGNTAVSESDGTWSIQVTAGTVREDVAAADLTITGLPAGLSAGVARGEGNTIVITVSGTAQQAVSRLTTVSVAVRGSAVAEPGAADSEPVTVFLNPAPVREEQVTVSAEQPDLTLDGQSPAATVVVPQSVTDARINLVPLLSEADGAKTAVLPAELTVRADTSAGQIRVEIPAGTAVTAPAAWTGALNVPAVRPNSSVTVTPDAGKTATVHSVIEIGFDDLPLTFDRAVRIVFPGQAGKEVGYYRGGSFTKITTVMTSDTQEAGDALPAGGDGRIDVGQDLVVWTRHFTRFVIYTQTSSGGGQPPSSDNVSVYIRVEGYDRTVVPRTRITVDNFDLTPYLGPASGSSATPSTGWGPDKLTKPTVAHALIRALESVGIDCTDHSSGLDLQDYGWALYVAMIAGDREFDHRSTSGWLYRVNGWLPDYGCQAYTLKGGEDIFWYFAAYGFETWYSQLTASKTSVKTGEEITLTLTGTKTDLSGSSGSGPTVSAKLKGAVIYVDGQEYKPEGTAVVTDENGKAVIKFNNPGTYEVSAERFSGEGLRDIVRPLPVKITVSGSAIASGGAAAPVSATALEEAIQKAAATGLVTLQADSAQTVLALSRDQLSKIWEAKKPLAVTVQGVQFVLSADSLKVPELTAANAAQLQLKAEKLSAEDAQGLVATLAGQSRLVGEVYELDLVVVDKEGGQQSITQLPDCRVLLPVPAAAREAAAAGRVKACRYNEERKMWEEVGGTYDPAGGFISFKAEHFSKYALLETLSPAAIKTFKDILGHWAQKEIEFMAAKGYVAGVGDNRFAPEATVTRAQFAVIIARLAGLTARPEGAERFRDVPADAWYRGMVGAAAEAGLVAGTGETAFAPDEPITREQMAALLVRLLAQNGLDMTIGDNETAQLLAGFADAAEISPWARAAVALAVKEKLMRGREGGRFVPRGRATRAEAAVVLCRLLEKLPQLGKQAG